jgi:hypothetical protein
MLIILDGAIANGYGEMSFAAAGPTVKDQGAALGNKAGGNRMTGHRRLDSRLERDLRAELDLALSDE